MSENYDSTAHSLEHIKRVRYLLHQASGNLQCRAERHDASKLIEPEKTGYDQISAKLKSLEYGSTEYRASLKNLAPTIKHHYEVNDHHPEHYENGIDGMSLLSLLEMACDWKAASERHDSGNIWRSLDVNKDRFKMSDQLVKVLHNTFVELGFE